MSISEDPVQPKIKAKEESTHVTYCLCWEKSLTLDALFNLSVSVCCTIKRGHTYYRMCVLSCVQLTAIPWTVARQAPRSSGFPRQEYWSGLPFPPPGHLPDPGIAPVSLGSPALVDGFLTTSAASEAPGMGLVFTSVWCVGHSVVSDSLQPHGLRPTRVLCPWNSTGKHTGVCCSSLLQGIFPTQGSNPGLLHRRQIFYHLSHQGSHLPPHLPASGKEKMGICAEKQTSKQKKNPEK